MEESRVLAEHSSQRSLELKLERNTLVAQWKSIRLRTGRPQVRVLPRVPSQDCCGVHVAQWLEPPVVIRVVRVRIPSCTPERFCHLLNRSHALVAQMEVHAISNHTVAGSSPAERAILFCPRNSADQSAALRTQKSGVRISPGVPAHVDVAERPKATDRKSVGSNPRIRSNRIVYSRSLSDVAQRQSTSFIRRLLRVRFPPSPPLFCQKTGAELVSFESAFLAV